MNELITKDAILGASFMFVASMVILYIIDQRLQKKKLSR